MAIIVAAGKKNGITCEQVAERVLKIVNFYGKIRYVPRGFFRTGSPAKPALFQPQGRRRRRSGRKPLSGD